MSIDLPVATRHRRDRLKIVNNAVKPQNTYLTHVRNVLSSAETFVRSAYFTERERERVGFETKPRTAGAMLRKTWYSISNLLPLSPALLARTFKRHTKYTGENVH